MCHVGVYISSLYQYMKDLSHNAIFSLMEQPNNTGACCTLEIYDVCRVCGGVCGCGYVCGGVWGVGGSV